MTINHEQIDDLHRDCFRVLRWSDNVNRVERYDLQENQFVSLDGVGGQWHRHPEIEITFVATGRGLRMVGNETSEVVGGRDLVVLGSGLPHYWNFSGSSSGVCVQLNPVRVLDLTDEQSQKNLSDLFERAKFGLEFQTDSYSQAIETLNAISLPGHNRLKRYGLLLQLLGELVDQRFTGVRNLASIGFHGSRAAENYKEMQQVISWIIDNFNSPIQLQDAVKLVGMSRASFCRHFSASTGMSFTQFVNDIRVSNACKLLYDSESTIAAIAYEAGFSNLSNFNRIFQSRKQMTPSQFRLSIRNAMSERNE